MKIIGVIPARYQSSRFPGKPLANIFGKPMIWRVYQQALQVPEFDQVYVATDSIKISSVLAELNIPFIMTSDRHPNHISRIHEVSEIISADFYVCINGDEPLVDPISIQAVIRSAKISEYPCYYGAMRTLTSPAQTIDDAKIKLAIAANGRCIYLSRAPIPHPQGTLMFDYKKYMGIECFNKAALNFFVSTPIGRLEAIEDIDHLRFIENDVPLYFTEVESESISVDTPKDLDMVISIISKRQKEGAL